MERGGYAALVERDDAAGFGQVGSAGLVTPEGLAVLVWEGESPWFVTRRERRKASLTEVNSLREFARALADALKDCPT